MYISEPLSRSSASSYWRRGLLEAGTPGNCTPGKPVLDGRRTLTGAEVDVLRPDPSEWINAFGRSTPRGPASSRLLFNFYSPSEGPLRVRLNSRLAGWEKATLDPCQDGRDPNSRNQPCVGHSSRPQRRRARPRMDVTGRRVSPPILPGSGAHRCRNK